MLHQYLNRCEMCLTSKCWLQVLSCITFGDALGRAERQDPAPSRTMTPPQVPAQG